MPPKSRAAANADRAARAAARAGRSPAPVPPSAAGGGNRVEACTTPSQPAPPAPGSAATPAPMDSVVSPADLSAFPPLEAATSVSPAGGAPASAPMDGRASKRASRARKPRTGRSSADKGAKARAASQGDLGAADSEASLARHLAAALGRWFGSIRFAARQWVDRPPSPNLGRPRSIA